MKPPPHKSERLFRRYEPAIFRILSDYPNPVQLDPGEVATSTFTCRLRDAISSLIEFKWKSPIDVERLEKVWNDDLVISDRGSCVLAGPRDSLSSKTNTPLGVFKNPESVYSFSLEKPDITLLAALGVLLDRKLLEHPVKITGNAEPEVEGLKNMFERQKIDVEFLKEGNYWVMI